MYIGHNIYLIASGDMGFSLTNRYDCNAYLIDGGSSLALVDTGCGIESDRIINEIIRNGFDPSRIDSIFLTHAHADHAGGAYELSKQCGAQVFGLPDTARYVSNADAEAVSLPAAIQAGIYPPAYRLKPCPVIPFQDGSEFQIGDITIQAIETLGHSDGHASFLMNHQGKRILFGGDLIFRGGQISLQSTWDCRLDAYVQSIRKVAQLEIDSLYPGHLTFVLKEAHQHIQNAVSILDKLGIPPNIS